MGLSGRASDLPIVAKHPPRHGLVSLGWLEWTQTVSAHENHFVVVSATRFLDPRDPGPPGAVALVAFPGEQMPNKAADQLDERWCPWCRAPDHTPVCETVFDKKTDTSQFLADRSRCLLLAGWPSGRHDLLDLLARTSTETSRQDLL
jgi:hypothetical protein